MHKQSKEKSLDPTFLYTSWSNSIQNKSPSFLCKYISLWSFANLLKENQLILVPPESWQDPSENCLVNFKDTDANIFAQSWTKTAESATMWHTYSKYKDCLRIKIDFNKLIESLSQYKNIEITLGNVDYCKRNQFTQETERFLAKLDDCNTSKKEKNLYGLLIKKFPFRHEKECRLIIQVKVPSNCGNFRYKKESKKFDNIELEREKGLVFIEHSEQHSHSCSLKLEVDWSSLVKEILIDPTLDKYQADFIKEMLLYRFAYLKSIEKNIRQSTIYMEKTNKCR